ncbi:EpsG family protein [Polaribacter atrinae]|uniref:EpsG family protein n=1 Tax=Polaribacter atrinae TaxID=1333662 RepID=UPI0030F77757
MIKENINNLRVLFLFFIYPFGSFLAALKTLNSKYSFKVFFLFSILFGLTFIAKNESADSYRYAEEFNRVKNNSSIEFTQTVIEYFTFESNIKDIYEVTSYYLISRISDSYHVLMAFWAFVFAFFLLKSFRFFVNRIEFNNSFFVYVLAFLFVYSNPISNINGARFWTASWVAVYVVFQIVVNKRYLFFLLACITPLIHISFVFFIAILFIYVVSLKFHKLWVYIFMISFFVGNIALSLSTNYVDIMPQAVQNLVWSYTESDTALERIEGIGQPLYAEILTLLPYVFINIFIVFFIYNFKKIKNTEGYNVYIFILIWMSACNFTSAIPSFGARFFQMGIPFVMYLGLLMYKEVPFIKTLLKFAPVIYAYSIFLWLRFVSTIIDFDLFFSIFPHLLFKNLL